MLTKAGLAVVKDPRFVRYARDLGGEQRELVAAELASLRPPDRERLLNELGRKEWDVRGRRATDSADTVAPCANVA